MESQDISLDDIILILIRRYGLRNLLDHHINEVNRHIEMSMKHIYSGNTAGAGVCIGMAKDSCDILKVIAREKDYAKELGDIGKAIIKDNESIK